ncbi:MAG: hypothetical protein A3J28_10435 [Acidobacteria bacterium RIFCSPLOWO2_12_FULL_60_22]|nr:MAG: hypothetical protein A3J28_10435 [Acidobacteria bacterium RIFCSPLOWO2_12_FULL_60_22]
MRKNLLALIGLLLSWHPGLLSAQAQQTRKLDTTSFVVLGEGLAAGMANYGLNEVVQRKSFPAQIAQQMNTAFPQPLIQGPGLGDVLGYPPSPVSLPNYLQGSVRVFPSQPVKNDEAPTLFVFNLSVPNFRLTDSLNRRPVSPLIHNDDSQQTAINMILGFPSLILEREVPLWTQLEYARAMAPTMALVELGYFDVLAAAVAGNPGLIPDPASFRAAYATIVRGLRELQTEVVVTTIPDPMDTAYFSSPASATRLMRVPDSVIAEFYGINPQDFITPKGLSAIGNQFIRRQIEPLPPDVILRGAVGSDISNRVRALNAQISAVASEQGAVLYDLAGFFNRIRTTGLRVGSSAITGDYFGGFYSLDGYYPGATGQALIANEILGLLNRTYGESFPLLDLGPILHEDAVSKFAPARAPEESPFELQRPSSSGIEDEIALP